MQIINPIQINTANPAANQGQGGVLQNMRPGQSIMVEVVSAEPGILNVKTTDGQVLRAEFPGAMVMAPGDKLQLSLLADADGANPKFQLQTVNGQNVGVSVSDMEAKMIDMGVEPSEFNVKSAEFLAERGVLPTPERINILSKLASYYPKMPAAAALFVAANGIPVTRQNMYALMEWLKGGEMLGDQASELTEAVKKMIAESETAQQNTQKVPASQMPEAQTQRQPVQNTPLFSQSFIRAIQDFPNFPIRAIPQAALNSLAQTMANTAPQDAAKVIEGFLKENPVPDADKGIVSEALLSAYETASKNTAPTEGEPRNTNPILQQPQSNANTAPATKDSASVAQQNAEQSLPTVNTQEGQPAQKYGEQVKEPAQQNALPNEKNTPEDIKKADISIVSENKQADAPAKNISKNPQALQSENMQTAANAQPAPDAELGKILKQITALVASMKDDSAADAKTLEEAVKNQQHAAEAIKSGISKIVGDQSPAAQKAADMSAKVNIGTQLDNFYYCQVPFQLGEQKNTAELYVFKRKKQGHAADKTNTTILIALETQRMGRVETVLKAEDMSLSIEFRVDSAPVQKYIERETSELKKQLEESDFKVLDVRVVRIETPATPLNVDQVLGEKEEFKLKTIDISV